MGDRFMMFQEWLCYCVNMCVEKVENRIRKLYLKLEYIKFKLCELVVRMQKFVGKFVLWKYSYFLQI